MALANPSTTPEKLEDPARRAVLLATPALAAALSASAVGAACVMETGAITGDTVDDVPFLLPLAGDPRAFAVCVPARTIGHAHRYALSNGRTILAERLDRDRCNDGSGWRDCLPGEFAGRIIGRVVIVLERRPDDWAVAAQSRIAG